MDDPLAPPPGYGENFKLPPIEAASALPNGGPCQCNGCCMPCQQQMTQEDLRCDLCRERGGCCSGLHAMSPSTYRQFQIMQSNAARQYGRYSFKPDYNPLENIRNETLSPEQIERFTEALRETTRNFKPYRAEYEPRWWIGEDGKPFPIDPISGQP